MGEIKDLSGSLCFQVQVHLILLGNVGLCVASVSLKRLEFKSENRTM